MGETGCIESHLLAAAVHFVAIVVLITVEAVGCVIICLKIIQNTREVCHRLLGPFAFSRISSLESCSLKDR